MKLTKQQRLEKILSIIEKYKPHKNALFDPICRMCLKNKSSIYYYEYTDSTWGGFSIACLKCRYKIGPCQLRFKLSLQDRFLLEILL